MGVKVRFRKSGWPQKYAASELPLRSELFGAAQMERHGKFLAGGHKLNPHSVPDQLVTRLKENESVLVGICKLLIETVTANRRISPAGEWLLDNFHLIEEQILTAKKHFPKTYSRELPRLLNGPSAGLPRVYDIALEIISHGDGRIDVDNLSRFIAAYQSVAPLNLGELWAIPIMLRLALIENLRRVGSHIGAQRANQDLANSWADKMIEIADRDPKSLILETADMARSNPPMVSSFVAELARRLQGQGPALALPLTWVEQRLAESGSTTEQMVQSETMQQVADQASISNSIGSLRLLSAIDWRDFVESESVVEKTLRQDPSEIYAKMTFATRDQYRHVIERMAKHSPLSEVDVAIQAIELASTHGPDIAGNDRYRHVGYYLIDKGVSELERSAGVRASAGKMVQQWCAHWALILYLGGIATMTLVLTAALFGRANNGSLADWQIALVSISLFLVSFELAVAFTNRIATALAVPKSLPRMDFMQGIPEDNKTLVVVPTMLGNNQNIESLLEALEVRFLANRDSNLRFGLLTDFNDAKTETTPTDEPLLVLARDGIEALNQKYSGEGGGDIFFLFHRPRVWVLEEETWMAYERKRGKLSALNAFLRDQADNSFSLVVGDLTSLGKVKYVVTLDTDTQLPRDAARQFVGTMAHPLNCPRYDEMKQRIAEGYAILQPRMAIGLPGANKSLYSRLYGGEPGIDPYTRVTSDVYQDLFGEGSFIGKGIYDIDAFELAIKDRFPDNRILSHDLLEGCYARSGLLSDVELYEDYPSRYTTDLSRRHRWTRGDWQLLDWITPSVPQRGKSRQQNPLSVLSRWKIFDNFRRSLTAPALLLLFLLSWTVLSAPLFWTSTALMIFLLPCFLSAMLDLSRKSKDVRLRQHLPTVFRSAKLHCGQAALAVACLPCEAISNLNAISRTLWRLMVSHKHLLEWSTAAETSANTGTSLASFCRTMYAAPTISIAVAFYLFLCRPQVLPVALPLLLIWLASPLIAWWMSRPLRHTETKLTPLQTIFLYKVARKTWAFFDTIIGPEDNWLPPDNLQESPVEKVAHRTSPTNMGLALLANLCAHNFGYITCATLIERTKNAFNTMNALEKYRGHFFNWYDTVALKPLLPAYISTVDSGNLSGHLLTLRPGLQALSDQQIVDERIFYGLRDTLNVLHDTITAGLGSQTTIEQSKQQAETLVKFQKQLESACKSPPKTLASLHRNLTDLNSRAVEVARTFATTLNSDEASWVRALGHQCQQSLDDLTFLVPWITLTPPADDLTKSGGLDDIPTLRQLAALELLLLPVIEERLTSSTTTEESSWLTDMKQLTAQASQRASSRIDTLEQLALQAGEFARTEYDFLYDKARRLLSIGYNVSDRRLDSSYYDLLASEARLCTFVAIAEGQLPQESWFALGRLLTSVGGDPVLLSWSGSMFEYLMPLLVMPTYANTLLDRTYRAEVKRQIEYGRQRGVPWGISESGYNLVDGQQNYQYHPFGVPGLGLKRGLADDVVVAPYATALALMVDPEAACHNLQTLSDEQFEGRYGFFEAIDYTASRLPPGQSHAVVRSFMSHHQGMTLLSLAYTLLKKPMQQLFENEPSFKATLPLLQERLPAITDFHLQTSDISGLHMDVAASETPVRVFTSPDTATPEVQLLSNGRYNVMITNSGGGYSRWTDFAVTRWREDSTCDNWGNFCYIKDVDSGEFWSTTHQPTLKRSEKYEAIFSEARIEFRRYDHDIETHSEVVVSSEDDIELRKVRLTNRSWVRRTIEVTSYTEVVLAPSAAEALHPAFSNLFVQTEILPQRRAILCTRRPRSVDEHSPWLFHLLAAHGGDVGQVSYETDRSQFLGRGRTTFRPEAMDEAGPMSGSQGSVLDPIVSIRRRIVLAPAESTTVYLVTGIAGSRDASLALVEKYRDKGLADRVFDLAWTHGQVVLRQLNATDSEGQLYCRLASSIIYANPIFRAEPSVLIKNRRGQSGLWGYSISGDLPIVLVQIRDTAAVELVRQLVQAHAYWRMKGLQVDLVIWNEDSAGYRQLLQEQIMALIAGTAEAHEIDRPGGIFVRAVDQIAEEDRVLMQSTARAILSDSRGTLDEQLNRRGLGQIRVPRLTTTQKHSSVSTGEPPVRDLILRNGLGGFTPDGREYVITTRPGQVTPAPWANVLANPYFGTVISENGVSYTWAENAHEYRLTPWHNDPISDSSGEVFYIRDEESGHFWSPAPLPKPGTDPYVSRHGFGYSVFEHNEGGIVSELTVFVALDAPIKFSMLKVRNNSGRPRRLSTTGYAEWVLGDLRPKMAMHTVTEIDPKSGALFARNAYNTEFADRVSFFDVDDLPRTLTGDRTEFIGRNGTLANPQAMGAQRLSNKVGAALDPCAAIQVQFDLADGQERDIVFRLGSGRDAEDASTLVHRFRGSARHASYERTCEYWKHTLGTVNVQTPDDSLNMLTNGWLLYQTIACRVWGRSGYYQSGGAFGFRDQLQDMMALVHAEPRLMREHLLRCASRQFLEGDVQHWWHPPSGRGVRTHCSDDYLWLPLATCRYVLAVGDTGVLDEPVNFLEGRPVNPEDDSYYELPNRSEQTSTLYDHCVRAIKRGLRFGKHRLPLMGGGDWNDGMNLVGHLGKGESIWLAFFLYDVLVRFTNIARLRGDQPFVDFCLEKAEKIRQNIEKNGWDGEWYRRAYFDDGTPLGSAANPECQIDSIAQSWSVLSGAGQSDHALKAMDSLNARLVRPADALVRLLDPPFDQSELNPGYIKGYLPGVRENGGQYTHAAIWAAMAFASLGDRRRAWQLLDMINPVNHARSEKGVATYKVEPYVVAGDVYAVAPHTGRGGWTWYTGSAGWLYRLIVESLLGLKLEVDKITFAPCLPEDWTEFKLHYRFRETVYHITVLQDANVTDRSSVIVDGACSLDDAIYLQDDRREHFVEVRLCGRSAGVLISEETSSH